MKAKIIINDIAKLVLNGCENYALIILESYHDEICKKQREKCANFKYDIRHAPKPEFE